MSIKKTKWTGERLETFIQTENTTEHLHRYAIACSISNNLDVLDIASGEGYGSNLLAKVAKKVTGVDISKEAVDLAVKKYKKSNIEFKVGSAAKIPMQDSSVDIVVSFETLEHHDQHEEMLKEIMRVLKPGGILLMSSPDKKNYSDIPNLKNPFHVKELYFSEFKDLINRYFSNAEYLLQKIVVGSLIIPEGQPKGFMEYSGNYENVQSENDFASVFNICFASNNNLPKIPSSLFDGRYINRIILENAVQSAISEAQASWRYRIGSLILFPTKLFKK